MCSFKGRLEKKEKADKTNDALIHLGAARVIPRFLYISNSSKSKCEPDRLTIRGTSSLCHHSITASVFSAVSLLVTLSPASFFGFPPCPCLLVLGRAVGLGKEDRAAAWAPMQDVSCPLGAQGRVCHLHGNVRAGIGVIGSHVVLAALVTQCAPLH